MSDSSSNHQIADSADSHDANIDDASIDSNDAILPRLESPGLAPGGPNTIRGDAGAATSRKPAEAAPASPKGTMVILVPPHARTAAPEPAPASIDSSSRSRLGSRTAMVAAAAAIGGLAGSLATAGISHLTTPESAAPPHYSTLAEALGRVDRELTTLKAAAESAADATGLQAAKVAERIDRIEKTQAEAGAKPAKAPDLNAPMERRVAAASSDITGTVTGSRAAGTAVRPVATTIKPPAPTPAPVVDGWVVRAVHNGSALIEGRAGLIEVIPGDNLRGLGRIKEVTRQDGRWVVVTNRGRIVSR